MMHDENMTRLWRCYAVYRQKKTWNSGASLICVRSGEQEVLGSIPGRDMPKSLKMVLAAPHLALRFTG